jgi:hypothetical protein
VLMESIHFFRNAFFNTFWVRKFFSEEHVVVVVIRRLPSCTSVFILGLGLVHLCALNPVLLFFQ